MVQKPATELLLCCLHTQGDRTCFHKLQDEWDEVVQLAAQHAVAPLLYQRLQTSTYAKVVPAQVMQLLQQYYLQNTVRNMELYKELHRVLRVFQSAKVPVIVLKGAHLAQTVYGNVALRTMSDVDLLVREPDASSVEDRLRELGCVPDDRKIASLADYAQSAYVIPDSEFGIEVHWHIQPAASPFRVDLDGIWERAAPSRVAGVEAFVLSPEDLLLHLCLHMSAHHLYSHFGLRSLCDVAETMNYYGDTVQWTALQQRTQEWGIGNSVYLTLRLAKKLVRAAVPDQVLQALCPDDFEPRFLYWAEARIFAELDERDEPAFVSDHLGQAWNSRRLSRVLGLALRSCFPKPHEMSELYALPQGSPRVYLYYPVRVADMVSRRARTLWLLLRRDQETLGWIDQQAGRTALSSWFSRSS